MAQINENGLRIIPRIRSSKEKLQKSIQIVEAICKDPSSAVELPVSSDIDQKAWRDAIRKQARNAGIFIETKRVGDSLIIQKRFY